MDNSINIREIQHYMYCPRRFALLRINNDWAENAFVVKANIIHENVHSGKHDFSDKNKIVRSCVSVYNDLAEYNLYGILDCIEFVRNKNGTCIEPFGDSFIVNIVEYKPKPPKDSLFHESDAIQVFAQKLCVDYVFKCDSKCYIYYSETRKRVLLPFETEYEQYDETIKKYLSEMQDIIKSVSISVRAKGQKCSGCSLSDICFPKITKYDVKKEIMLLE